MKASYRVSRPDWSEQLTLYQAQHQPIRLTYPVPRPTYPIPPRAQKRVPRRRRRRHGVETGLVLTVAAVATRWCAFHAAGAAVWRVGVAEREFWEFQLVFLRSVLVVTGRDGFGCDGRNSGLPCTTSPARNGLPCTSRATLYLEIRQNSTRRGTSTSYPIPDRAGPYRVSENRLTLHHGTHTQTQRRDFSKTFPPTLHYGKIFSPTKETRSTARLLTTFLLLPTLQPRPGPLCRVGSAPHIPTDRLSVGSTPGRARASLFFFRKIHLYGKTKKSTHGHQNQKPFGTQLFNVGLRRESSSRGAVEYSVELLATTVAGVAAV